jgi:hypothetical protein
VQAVVWLLAVMALVVNIYLVSTFVTDPDQVRVAPPFFAFGPQCDSG